MEAGQRMPYTVHRHKAPIDTASIAHVLGGLGGEFAKPAVAEIAKASANKTADAITEIIL
jgi:hypothetical protein